MENEANPKAIHICNSHKTTRNPKIAKELVYLPLLFYQL